MKSNYHIAYNKGWEDLAKKDPYQVAEILHVTYISGQKQFVLPYFNETYIVDRTDRSICRETDGTPPELSDAILMLHYLTYFETTIIPEDHWVSLKDIPNGGALFYPAFHKKAIIELIDTFGSAPSLLGDCASRIGGEADSFGDVSFTFQAFPLIPLCVVVWEGEDDIPPNATILFDPSVTHLLHIESIIMLGEQLADKLIKLTEK